MATYDTITPSAPKDGIVYSNAFPVPTSEGDIFNGPALQFHPVPITYNETFLAIIQLVYGGTVASNTTYIIAQTSLDGVNWIDVGWITDTGTGGPAAFTDTFVLAGGQAIGANFAFARAANSNPAGGNGGNAIPLGGQLRFVGKSTLTGTLPTVKATVTYKLRGIR